MPCGIPTGQAAAVTLVEDTFSQLTVWASDASIAATAALNNLANLDMAIPTNPYVGYSYEFLQNPNIAIPDEITNPLTGLTISNAEFELDSQVDQLPVIGPVSLDLDSIQVPDDFDEAAPVVSDINRPGQLSAVKPDSPSNIREFTAADYPTAPVVTYTDGLVIPSVPTMVTLDFPDSPTITLPTAPSYVSPSLSSPLPSAIFDFTATDYSSSLLTAVSAELLDRVQNGGTGLNPVVEQSIWDRARNREDVNSSRSELELLQSQTSRGFSRPTGSQQAALDFMAQETQSKIADLSREIAIKQADLEQKNLEYSIQAAISLEGQLIQAHTQQQDLLFKSAETTVKLAYELYSLEIATLNVELEIYKTNFQVFTAQVQAELAQIEIYKAEIDAQVAIGKTNQQLIDIYSTRVDAVNTAVVIFKNEVEGVNSQIEAEKLKLQQYGLALDGYTKEIEAYRTEYDAYSAELGAEKTKSDIYSTNASVYATRIQAYSTRVDAEVKGVAAEIDIEKLDLAAYQARLSLQEQKFAAARSKAAAVGVSVGAEGNRFSAESSLGIAQATAQAETARTNATIAKNAADVALSNAQIYTTSINAYRDASLRGAISLAELTSNTQIASMGAMSVGSTITSGANDSINQSYSCS